MKSQISLVAEQFRLQQWAEQIQSCQNRPHGMKVTTWCDQHGITRANYYYRLQRVREACLTAVEEINPPFVELPVPTAVEKVIRSLTQPRQELQPQQLCCVLPETSHWKFLHLFQPNSSAVS